MSRPLIILFLLFSCYNVNSQVLNVYEADTSAFPIVKAKYFLFDADYRQDVSISKDDMKIYEDGAEREVLEIECPEAKPEVKLSTVITVEGNCTFYADIEEALGIWFNSITPGNSECAITNFDNRYFEDQNYLVSDFTDDKGLLFDTLDFPSLLGCGNYDAGFLYEPAGSISIAKNGKYKRIIIFLTGVNPDESPNIEKIISDAKENDITIYTVAINIPCPQCLKEIAEGTGGKWYNSEYSYYTLMDIISDIMKTAKNIEPCNISWRSDNKCTYTETETEFIVPSYDISDTVFYRHPYDFTQRLEFEPEKVFFINKQPGSTYDTTITVKAYNADFNVSGFEFSKDNFSITPASFTLAAGESISLKLQYNVSDSSYVYSDVNVQNDICETIFNCGGGYAEDGSGFNFLHLVSPDGGETFPAGSDVQISWEGISEEENVSIEYSTNKGVTWNPIVEKASGLSYLWEDIPNISSSNCLIRVLYYGLGTDKFSEPDIEWSKTYGSSMQDDIAGFLPVGDGYILLGDSEVADGDVIGLKGKSDIWLVRIDSAGNILWQKTYGGSRDDYANSICRANDGGFFISGSTSSSDFDLDGYNWVWAQHQWVFKIDIDGNIQWQYIDTTDYFYYDSHICPTLDNGVIITGYSLQGDDAKYFVPIIKLNSSGKIDWTSTIYNPEDRGGSIHSTITDIDSSYLMAGYRTKYDTVSENRTNSDLYLTRMDKSGKILWKKSYGGDGEDDGVSLILSDDGGIIIAGISSSYNEAHGTKHENRDVWIIKTDRDGNLLWSRPYGGSESDYGWDIFPASDGGFIVTAASSSNNGDISEHHHYKDAWIFKIDRNGNLLWEKSIGGSNHEGLVEVYQMSDGKYILGGSAYSSDCDLDTNRGLADLWVVKLESDLAEALQQDMSDNTFSIVSPDYTCEDIDMGKVLIDKQKDSVIADFIKNNWQFDLAIDTIYIRSDDAGAFSVISGSGAASIASGAGILCEFGFKPDTIGPYKAEIVIITQADTTIRNIIGSGINEEIECDELGFEYPDFSDIEGLNIIQASSNVDDFIRLTYANENTVGGLWYKTHVPVKNGFVCEFSFRMSKGDNNGVTENSVPGADGITFLLQNTGNTEFGQEGGGVGYHGIKNALGIEIDLFANDKNQIINFNDPDGNHVAVQSNGVNELSSFHNEENTLGISSDIPELQSDGTIYYAKIEYNLEPNTMLIYISEDKYSITPVLVIDNLDISSLLELDKGEGAYVGFTSATGNAVQIHDLLDWYFCPLPSDVYVSVEDRACPAFSCNVYPNPASEQLTIEINNPIEQNMIISITDIFGRNLCEFYNGLTEAGPLTMTRSTDTLPDGLYLCRIKIGSEEKVEKVLIIK